MRRLSRSIAAFAAATIFPLSTAFAGAPAPRLVIDVNTQPAGKDRVRFPAVALSSTRAVFAGVDDDNGTELWATNGTPGGTMLLADLLPGQRSSRPDNLVRVGSRVFFTADDGVHGRQLWVTDGTGVGTRLVKNVQAGAESIVIGDMAAAGELLYFVVLSYPSLGYLWQSDGTEAGTVPEVPGSGANVPRDVHDVVVAGTTVWFNAPSNISFTPPQTLWRYVPGSTPAPVSGLDFATSLPSVPLTSFPLAVLPDGRAVFAGASSYSTFSTLHAWVSDGSIAGTIPLESTLSTASGFTSLGPWVVFTGTDTTGRGLWRTDGTPAGTVLLKYTATGSTARTATELTRLGNFVYFAAFSVDTGTELWRTDGTPEGTARVWDFAPGVMGTTPDSGAPLALYAVENPPSLFLSAQTATGRELWRFDPATATAAAVDDIAPGAPGSDPTPTCELGGRVLFTADDGVNGAALYSTPIGGLGGSACLNEASPHTLGAAPTSLAVARGSLYFAADDGASGRQLWISDGSGAGTRRVSNPGPLPGGLMPQEIVEFGDKVFFAGFSLDVGTELFRSDGTAMGTGLAQDLAAGAGSSQPTGFVAVGANLCFLTNVSSGNGALYGMNDPNGVPILLSTVVSTADNSIRWRQSWRLGPRLFYHKNSSDFWFTDGTVAGTEGVFLAGSVPWSSSAPLGVLQGRELLLGGGAWLTDGTALGTVQLAPALGYGFGSSVPGMCLSADGATAFFVANSATNTADLWRTDGAAGGTTKVASLSNVPVSPAGLRVRQPTFDARHAAAVGPFVVFANDDGNLTTGTELWVSDGTSNGTHILKDINPGPTGSDPDYFVAAKGFVYFVATDPASGRELWRTDGTAAGTRRISDINPGPASSSPEWLTVYSNRLYFTATDLQHGRELWVLPLCGGDFNVDGRTTVSDIFDFISAWFVKDVSADFNSSGTLTVQDIFDFLGAWFAGCA